MRTHMLRSMAFTSVFVHQFALCVVPVSAAQRAPLTRREVVQMADAAIRGVLTSTTLRDIGRGAEPPIGFDRRGTMEAFGTVDNAATLSSLGMQAVVSVVTTEIIRECDQQGMGTCPGLGDTLYVLVQPVSTTRSTAVVSLHLLWATRSGGTRTYLHGQHIQVHLARSAGNRWRFVRAGRTLVS